MSELVFFPGEFKISTWFVWSLSQLVRLLPAKQLAISLTVEGEEAAQELLSAYACGIRHFPGSILEQAHLYQAKLPDIVLTAARLRKADICEADLMGADFRHADLRDASLIESNLVGANFSGSDLTGAWLVSADLSGADLRCACLHNTVLSGADLVGANFTGVNLETAVLDGVRWQANESRAYLQTNPDVSDRTLGDGIGTQK